MPRWARLLRLRGWGVGFACISPFVFGLCPTNAFSQGLPEQTLLDQIIGQLNELDAGIVASINRGIELLRRGQRYRAGGRTNNACNMQHFQLKLTNDRTKKSNSYSILLNRQNDGSPIKPEQMLVLTRVIHVDADGSPRTYHPNDPLGKETCKFNVASHNEYSAEGICALDTFNSGGIRVFEGSRRLEGEELERNWRSFWPLIREKRIRSVNLSPKSGFKVRRDYYAFHWSDRNLTAFFKEGIIPQTKEGYPCTYASAAPFPGYFVVATTLKIDSAWRENNTKELAPRECEAERNINAEQVAFFVLPSGHVGNMKIGDIVVARAKIGGENRLVFGVVGDAGPAQSFGEGSIALIKGLYGRRGEPVMNTLALDALDIGKDSNVTVAILILGGTKALLAGDYSPQNVEKVGKAAFAKWGAGDGFRRLDSCVGQARMN
jgi:hypothetical protein